MDIFISSGKNNIDSHENEMMTVVVMIVLFCLGYCHKRAQTCGLTQQEVTLSQFWRLEVQEPGVRRIGFFGSLAPWLRTGHLASASSAEPFSVPVSTSPLLIRTLVELDRISLPFLKAVSKYSHILRDWGWDFYIMNWEWGTVQPITVTMGMMMIVMLPWSKKDNIGRIDILLGPL